MTAGLLSFFYLGALWYAAPAFFREPATAAERLRATALLGIAIPGALGAFHLLYAPAVWAVALLLAGWRAYKGARPFAHDSGMYATLAATLVVLWAPLVRPLLDGDTLAYHLPIAVNFVQTHSVWNANAPYWLYPPASELFAAGLFAASGRWSLPLAGAVPALLLSARLYRIARESGAPAYAAAAVPLAFICMPVAAFQGGTLQNDLWLAAFFVEVVSGADRSPLSVAVCALLKPFGWIEGAIAAACARLPWRAAALGFVPLLFWLLRDGVLVAKGAGAGFSAPFYFPGTIAGNLGIAPAELLHGISTVTPQSFVWLAALAVGSFFRSTRRYAIAGVAVLVLYAFLPLAYSDGATNFVLDASSWRFALPALACGALVVATMLPRSSTAFAIGGYAVAAWGAWTVLAVFWNDGYTRWAIAVAAIAVTAALFSRRSRGLSGAVAVLAILLAGSWGASTRAPGFYADWMRDASGKSTGAFAWIAQHRPERVVAENVRAGAVLMSSPQTRTSVALLLEGCGEARRQHALLFAGTNEGLTGALLTQAFSEARSCGDVVYEDGAAVIARPR